MNEDEMRYRKKTDSNTSKAAQKSNHKHLYEYVLCRESFGTYIYCVVRRRCKICGKLRPNDRPEYYRSEKTASGYRSLSDQEMMEKFKNLPFIDYTLED